MTSQATRPICLTVWPTHSPVMRPLLDLSIHHSKEERIQDQCTPPQIQAMQQDPDTDNHLLIQVQLVQAQMTLMLAQTMVATLMETNLHVPYTLVEAAVKSDRTQDPTLEIPETLGIRDQILEQILD